MWLWQPEDDVTVSFAGDVLLASRIVAQTEGPQCGIRITWIDYVVHSTADPDPDPAARCFALLLEYLMTLAVWRPTGRQASHPGHEVLPH